MGSWRLREGGLMKVPFLDLKKQYRDLMSELEPVVRTIFETTGFIGGQVVRGFENEIADYIGTEFAVGCGNGTDALTLALRACGVKPGDEVITTPFTFFATAEAIASIGALPVFVDIREEDYNIDPAKIEAAITDRTKALLPVHIFGAPCDMDAINEIAHRHGLKVIEDCAQAIGSTYKGKRAGSLGDIGCFSFYPTKNLGGAGDGGMCTTNDHGLNTVLHALREHGAGKNGAEALKILEGISVEESTTEQATELYDPHKYYNYLIGYNSRLDVLQAAVLSVKLRHLDAYNAARAAVAKRYCSELTLELIRPSYREDITPCWHQFVVRAEKKKELCSYLTAQGVGCGTFYPVPLHRQKAFHEENCVNAGAHLPVAEMISSQSVCLPIYPELAEDQVDTVIEIVNEFYSK